MEVSVLGRPPGEGLRALPEPCRWLNFILIIAEVSAFVALPVSWGAGFVAADEQLQR